jgi:hypothetical protein
VSIKILVKEHDMKKTAIDALIQVLISFLFYCVVTFLSSIILADKGCVRIGGVYYDNNTWQKNIELVNYTDNYCNDIFFKLPISAIIENENFISTLLIEVEQIKSQEYKLYKISNIQPKSSSVIIISFQNKNDLIQFTNLKEKKFSLEEQGKIESPRFKLFKQLLPNLILYVIFIFCTLLYNNNNNYKIQQKLDDIINEQENNDKKFKEKKSEIEMKVKNLQKKIFLIKKQLLDFSKENEFWRNTIRQLLYNGDKKNKQAEHIFEIVTNNLQTYTIKSKSNLDLNEILFLADELEKNNDK